MTKKKAEAPVPENPETTPEKTSTPVEKKETAPEVEVKVQTSNAPGSQPLPPLSGEPPPDLKPKTRKKIKSKKKKAPAAAATKQPTPAPRRIQPAPNRRLGISG